MESSFAEIVRPAGYSDFEVIRRDDLARLMGSVLALDEMQDQDENPNLYLLNHRSIVENRKSLQSSDVEDQYSVVSNGDEEIQDFHKNHTLKIDVTIKQKLFEKLTNFGYSVQKSSSQNKVQINDKSLTYLLGFTVDKQELFDKFVADMIWMTYKKDFKPLLIEKTSIQGQKVQNLTTDCNWGCVIRSGQMLVANALVQSQFFYQVPQILELQFSICSFNDGIITMDKLLEKGCQIQKEDVAIVQNLYMSFDENVTRFSDGYSLSQNFKEPEWINEVLVIVNARLGMEGINSNYHQVILKYMKFPQFIGLMGGKPKKAYYFIGQQEYKNGDPAKLIYLDPHVVQKYSKNISKNYQQEKAKYHTTNARLIKIKNLDPCLGFGYLIKNYADYKQFYELLRKYIEQDKENSLFTVFEKFDYIDDDRRYTHNTASL
ncbi:UNKNOWN [Stylonychia lemnae]|uniref:Cysteine protease n=1 Tax=Stylonychia lemnae TaxID=5949 RepID=A0A077ZT08_STYLE|nr:UNKNOWN [Stylonychia lemnae]|eukprot:CDW71601.1 UNKNOWN [Stylonychia lemnae]